MSADNWTTCPKCRQAKDEKNLRLGEAVHKAYGEVSREAYLELSRKAAAEIAKPIEESFREDYNIGVEDGEFEVNYTGSCRVCGLKYGFHFKEKVSW